MMLLQPTAAAVSPSSCCAVWLPIPTFPVRRYRSSISVRCANSDASDISKAKLKVGSPIVIIEEPPMLKTAASVPSLRQNAGRVKPGDVGRIMARKPKDVWAVRLAVGTYLLDGKHFKALEVVDEEGDSSNNQAEDE
ncbi:protein CHLORORESPIRATORY REDUCTION 42, chloroplastic-like [Lolium rigidum]|uniref:protein CHLORORESPIRATORY REDUCTION 42, chloroplastic-like n=1 Tax=Lolium rigidum TaxID=89674 RepID=UPI001F5C8F14|nr:protein CHLORORESPIRATORY REDUCTION 42, chloroplastic-like [Lolium rigidum]